MCYFQTDCEGKIPEFTEKEKKNAIISFLISRKFIASLLV